MIDPTPEQLAEAAKRLGWETPIKPSAEALEATARRYPDKHDAEKWRLAQAEEMLIRYRADLASRS